MKRKTLKHDLKNWNNEERLGKADGEEGRRLARARRWLQGAQLGIEEVTFEESGEYALSLQLIALWEAYKTDKVPLSDRTENRYCSLAPFGSKTPLAWWPSGAKWMPERQFYNLQWNALTEMKADALELQREHLHDKEDVGVLQFLSEMSAQLGPQKKQEELEAELAKARTDRVDLKS